MDTKLSDAPDDTLVWTYRDVMKHVKLGRTTIDALLARGEFPKPRSVGGKFLFDAAEVREWFRNLPRAG